MTKSVARLRAVVAQPATIALALSALLVGTAYWGRLRPHGSSNSLSSDVLVLSAAEVHRLGGGSIPTWSQLQEAYGLSKRQIERSGCLTEGLDGCARDVTRDGEALAAPRNGRLILSLSDR